jgi:dTDP-4-amino-4,6-dideoxygalactose transaminase
LGHSPFIHVRRHGASLLWPVITAVFCDADPLTLNLDLTRVEEMSTPRTTAIIGKLLREPSRDVEALAEIALRSSPR